MASAQEEIERLKKEMAAIKEDRHQERQRRYKAEEEAHKERERAQKERERAHKERERREKAEEEMRDTTLSEYLKLCHEHWSERINVQKDKKLSTQGDPSNAEGKLRPDRLAPWTDFITTQKETLESLYSLYPLENMVRALPSRHTIKSNGKEAGRPLASEQDLAVLERNTVETPVSEIVGHLKTLDDVRNEFSLAGGVGFHNHLNALNVNENADALAQKFEDQTLGPFTPPRHLPSSILNCQPDQVCVYATANGGAMVTLVVEYKAPHKVTCGQLRYALHALNEPLELNSVINEFRAAPSKNTKRYFEYHAERLVAAVISQTFSYMVNCGIQYSYVTTGEAFIFLRIKPEENAHTVYYHLAIPNEDVKAQKNDFGDTPDYLNRTAIGQVLAFTLLAIKSLGEPQEWRERAVKTLKYWEVDYEAVLREIEETPEAAGKPLSDYKPRTYRLGVPPTDRELRSSKASHDDSTTKEYQGTPPSSDDESPSYKTPTRAQGGRRGQQGPPGQRVQRTQPPNGGATSRGGQKRAFCTQLCLQGLAQGGPLDRQCPNMLEHCEEGYQGNLHQLSGEKFRKLLEEQLRRDRGDACEALWLQGARGALFKVTLTSHGYTVAGKGTPMGLIRHLRHEAEVYQRLVALQGIHIPVYLGSIDLISPFYFDTGVRIMHFILLSWAGQCLDESKTATSTDRQTWTSDLVCAVNAIHAAGVLHKDVRMPNVLWNEETKRVMVIDFERAEIVKADIERAEIVKPQAQAQPVRQALASISPNQKRKRASGVKEAAVKEAGMKDIGADMNVLETMKKDPRIDYQVWLEQSNAQALGGKARRAIEESESAALVST